MSTIRVRLDLTDIDSDGKIYTDNEGCGCCSRSDRVSVDEALAEVDCAINQLNDLRVQLIKMKSEQQVTKG